MIKINQSIKGKYSWVYIKHPDLALRPMYWIKAIGNETKLHVILLHAARTIVNDRTYYYGMRLEWVKDMPLVKQQVSFPQVEDSLVIGAAGK